MRQYVNSLRTNITATTATGGWTISKSGWQFSGIQNIDEAYVPFFGAFGTVWDDAMVARSSANPLGMLWPEMLRLPGLLERRGLVVLGTCPFCAFVLLLTRHA